jgi:hypothetical protein
MFEKASRLQLRFDTPKGSLTVEDLWDLDLTSTVANKANLDKIAQNLSKQLKETATESFVVKTTNHDAILQLKFDIVKHIIDVLLAEREVAKTAKTRKETKDRLLSILARKQDEQLEGKTVEELQAEIAAL